MRFALDPEQIALRDTVRALLDRHCTGEHVRKAVELPEGHDLELWRRMARELGLQGIALPEDHGGSGAGFVELAVVLTELGRAAAPGPFFSTVALAAPALLRSGDERACTTWLPGIADGDTTATLAVFEARTGWSLDPVTADPVTADPATAARAGSDGWRLTGGKDFVSDGADVDLLLVLAGTDDGPALFAVPADAPGLHRTGHETFDLTRRLASVTFQDTPAQLVGAAGGGLDIVRDTLDRAAIAQACEQVGGAARCLDTATEYAKNRVQFNRPIGSFQAVKHILADVLVDNESAGSAADYAAWAVDHAPDEVPRLAALCKAFASDAYLAAAKASIQVHGGIGFTWEHDAHLHLRRATSSAQFLGSPDMHRERLASHIFDGARGGCPA